VRHSTCYSRFTALPNDGVVSSQESSKTAVLRSPTVTYASTSSDVLSPWFIFCKKSRKKLSVLESPWWTVN